jgi:hypothetical protein
MCTVLYCTTATGCQPIAVNKYIISYHLCLLEHKIKSLWLISDCVLMWLVFVSTVIWDWNKWNARPMRYESTEGITLCVLSSPVYQPFFYGNSFYAFTLEHPLQIYTTSKFTPPHFWFTALWLVYFHLIKFPPPYGNVFLFMPSFSGKQLRCGKGLGVYLSSLFSFWRSCSHEGPCSALKSSLRQFVIAWLSILSVVFKSKNCAKFSALQIWCIEC